MVVDEVYSLCNIDRWFLRKLQGLVAIETQLKLNAKAIARLAEEEWARLHSPASDPPTSDDPPPKAASPTPDAQYRLVVRLLRAAKRAGFSDHTIAELAEIPEMRLRALRKRLGIVPVYKMVDTCAAEFEAETPYYYSCYDLENET
jgi:carbamoyl-phosphate synthase large subunit